MRDTKISVPATFTLLIALAGCGQDGSAAAASATASASACSAEHTTVADGGFCVKLPTQWEMKPAQKQGATRTDHVWFRKGEGGIFVIDVDTEGKMPDDAESQIAKSKDPRTVTKGEFAGGKGKWVMSLDEKGGIVAVLVAGPKGLVHCGGSSDPESLKKTLALCQTILPL